MRDTSLLAHELLCLHLKSFYGVEFKAAKKSRLPRLRKYR
jgi:hypothetical protein